MLRPPYGAYNASTLAAAGRCGLDWVVHWSVSLPGKTLEYQTKKQALEPATSSSPTSAPIFPARLRKGREGHPPTGASKWLGWRTLLPRGVADRSG